MEKVQLEILGISASPASNGAYALILKETNGSRRLPIVIGSPEAQSIANEMEGVHPPRPMTHDLIKKIIESFNGVVTEVTIVDLKDTTFYASISVEGIYEDIDARPSDAIAIAVRFNAPIFILETILDEAGFLPESETETSDADGEEEDENDIMDILREDKEAEVEPEKALENIESLPELEQLKVKLAKAIKNEQYELAAQLRDEVQKFQGS